MNLIERLKNQEKMNETQQSISEYILQHSEEIPQMSARTLAKKTYTNASTIIRFIKKLGYENYNDFKVHLVRDLKDAQLEDVKIREKEMSISIIDKISELEKNVIEKTKNQLSVQQLERVAQHFQKITYIDFISNDANTCLGDYGCHLFFLAQKIATNYTATNLQLYLTMTPLKDHAIVLISRMGEDKRVVKVAREFRKKGIYTIAITGRVESTLAKCCDEVIPAIHIDSFADFRDMIFQISTQYIFNCLFSLMLSDNYRSIIEFNEAYGEVYIK
ncbi:MurR/RpiR family transcriptional regulator [Longibaculum muris]|uniref:MurR/RpiR family transcriptional regulator n=1 Tax=Longibaculum muris TaxID=1796628 RepID=UPI0022E1B827|nr:MurR/RpiR family transcriptional regulator [Longibaculum muris]